MVSTNLDGMNDLTVRQKSWRNDNQLIEEESKIPI